jgi:competence protein ComEC
VRAVLLGFAAGVWCLQQRAALPDGRAWIACCVAACIALGVARWRREYAWPCAVVIACLCGFSWAAARAEWRLKAHLPVEYEQRDIKLDGFVRGLPEASDEGSRFLFEVEANGAGLDNFPRLIRLNWMPSPKLEAGQRWTLTARLKRPHSEANFGLRDMEVSMLERGIRATGYVSMAPPPHRLAHDARGPLLAIERLRSRLRARIDSVLADAPHRGIVVALAVGAQDAIGDADWTLMRATGTSHLVAISGLHIGFVAGLAALACGCAWRRLRFGAMPAALLIAAPKVSALGATVCAALYAALAGFNIPAQRTLWMLFVVAMAYLCGRRPASSLVWCWALACVLIADPWAVTSPGFWLSFGAVAAILFAIESAGRHASKRRAEAEEAFESLDWNDRGEVAANDSVAFDGFIDEAERGFGSARVAMCFGSLKRVMRAICRACSAAFRAFGERLRSGIRVQYAVTLALAPLTVYWFSQIPLIGPLANAFAIPWISAVVTPATLAGLVLPAPLDAHAFHLAHAALSLLCDALTASADAAARASLTSLWRLPQPDAFALSSACAGVAWALAPRGWPLRFAAPLAWLPLLASTPSETPAGALRVTALDIGQGSALVVETARHALLFDAGPGPESTHAGERITAPYLLSAGVRRLDTLMISHSDSDHAGGAPAVLDALGVRQLLASLPADDPLWAHARERGAQTLRCAAGQRWNWDGVDFQVLWPDAGPLAGKPNRQSCVLKATSAAGRAVLLTGDIEADVERVLIARGRDALRADVLIAPHHGSRTSSTEPFLDAVGPLAAVFQVGYRNRFHHPNPTVFARYELRGIPLARSDRDGAARLEMGSEITFERYRDTHARYWMAR